MKLAVAHASSLQAVSLEQRVSVSQATQQNPQLKSGTWLDIGTGSGAIAIGLSEMLPSTSQVGTVPPLQANCQDFSDLALSMDQY